jgi:hypothetical protein
MYESLESIAVPKPGVLKVIGRLVGKPGYG